MARLLTLVLIALLSVVACTSDGGPPRGVVSVDEPLPSFAGDDLDGRRIASASYDGIPLVVNVWATWCDPCVRELPALVEVAGVYEGRVSFLGVDYVDDAATASRWADDYGLPYPSISDTGGELAATLGFPYVPHTLVVDAGGTIRYRIYGETDAEELSGLLGELLATPAT